MCSTIKASSSGFYRWMKQQRGAIPPYEKYLLFRIREIYDINKGRYGSRRITQVLKRAGVLCYKNQVAKIMQRNGIRAKTKRKFRLTTDSSRSRNIASNLLNRNFIVAGKNIVWVGDITYIWTREGWMYLSTVIDLYSRKIIAWSLGKRMTKELVISTLKNAIMKRKPAEGLIFHSDRGSQYGSDDFVKVLESIGAKPSMSRKGDCWDNAVAESFFKTIKSEYINWVNFQTRQEAELGIFEYIELFYNRHRLHSAIGYMAPDEFERCIS